MSRSRLSTYRTGSVTPSAALLLRMERLVERRRLAVSAEMVAVATTSALKAKGQGDDSGGRVLPASGMP